MPKTPLVWKTEKRRVNDLIPFEKNPRAITDKQMEDLKRSISRFNLVEIAALDLDGTILAGHQRMKALQLLGRGEEEVDVRIPNRKLTDKEREAYLIASNALGGSWDIEKLKDFDVSTLMDIGFPEDELARLWDETLEAEDDGFDEDEEILKIKKPKSKPGDLIQLGSHRLVCGTSEDPAVLAKLMGSDKANIFYTDWPYNISLDYSKGMGGKKNYGGTMNDSKTDEDYKEFLKKCLTNAKPFLKTDAHIFSYCDQAYVWLFQTLYRELGIENRRVCLWLKNAANPTPKVAFNKAYEPVVYGTIGRPFIASNVPNLNEVLNKEIGTGNRLIDDVLDLWDVWLVKRLGSTEYEHPTQKPPTLHEKPLRRCSRPGDIVLDLCSGSGSLMASCEQLKRRAYMVELEPIFCDLIITRYEKLTGKKAKKLN